MALLTLSLPPRWFGVASSSVLGLIISAPAQAQALNVVPVTIQMLAGQRASALTIINQGEDIASFQLRAFRWTQADDGSEVLAPSKEISISPPLGSIARGASQVVRIIVRPSVSDKESSYRLLLDQIPAPAAPGTVRIALRLSLPVFSQPVARTISHLRFSAEKVADQIYLIATNDGGRHEKLQDIVIKMKDGTVLGVEANVSPYILAGGTRRWHVIHNFAPTDTILRLTAHTEAGQLTDQIIAAAAKS